MLDDTIADQWYEGGKHTFECTKTMMCLHWFILLKYYGEELFDDYLTHQYDLAQQFADIIQSSPSFELATHPPIKYYLFPVD